MKAWIQRVDEASVDIGGERVAEIGRGYLVLLGITHDDTERKARDLASRICGLRIFEDENGKINKSITDIGGSVIVVSQFTLYADTAHGRRPGFSSAGPMYGSAGPMMVPPKSNRSPPHPAMTRR